MNCNESIYALVQKQQKYVLSLTFFSQLQGFVMNLQPSEAEAGFDIRVPPTADAVSLERRIIEEWAPASRNMTFGVRNSVAISYYFANVDLFKAVSVETRPLYHL